MRIAITGSRGNLGQYLVSAGCIPIDSSILDIRSLKSEIRKIKPDIVINCAAYTNVDKAVEDTKQCYDINVKGIRNVLISFGGRVIHISTDYVFDGLKGDRYIEKDEENPVNYYGLTKLGSEVICATVGYERCIAVRTSCLYGGYKKTDIVFRILKEIQEKGEIRISNELKTNPTYIPHLSEALLKLCRVETWPEVLHITGLDTVSRYEIAERVSIKFLGKNLAIPDEMYRNSVQVKRPLNSGLSCDLAFSMGLPLYTFEHGLGAYRARLLSTSYA